MDPKPIFIRWHDAAAHREWSAIADLVAEPPVEVHTLGYLIQITETDYFVTTSIQNGEHNATMQIPKGCVVEFREVTL